MKVKGKSDKKIDSVCVDIKCEELCESDEFYSDYMIPFDESTIENVTKIIVHNEKFPKLCTEVTNENNKLIIITDEVTIPLELENGTYNMEELASSLSSSLEDNDVNIQIDVCRGGKVRIKSTDNEVFKLDTTDNSVLELFGFTGNKYEGKTTYISEDYNKLTSSEYYMYLENISTNSPLCKIDEDGNVQMLMENFDEPIESLNAVIVQFKDKKGNLIEFNGQKHSYKMEFYYEEVPKIKSRRR